MAKIAQIKITLANIRPPIWRRVLLEAKSTLADLHAIIQHVMGWEDYHLHSFESAGQRYAPSPDPTLELTWDEKPQEERKCTIEKLLAAGIQQLEYTYDFGDDWVHKIKIEKVLEKDPKQQYPACIKGKGACPPEDCGGPWGYASMLEVLEGPDCEEKQDMQDWLGQDSFDPEAFDLETSNDGLAEIKPGKPI